MKPDISKPRSDAWDAALDEGQRWAAYARFRAHPWHEVTKWIAEEFGCNPPSRTSLYA